MDELEKIVNDIITQDNRWTQDPIRCVLWKIKRYDIEDNDEEECSEKEILSYHLTERQAQEFIEHFAYKYKDMEIYVKSRCNNKWYSDTIHAMCKAVWKDVPNHYSS